MIYCPKSTAWEINGLQSCQFITFPPLTRRNLFRFNYIGCRESFLRESTGTNREELINQ